MRQINFQEICLLLCSYKSERVNEQVILKMNDRGNISLHMTIAQAFRLDIFVKIDENSRYKTEDHLSQNSKEWHFLQFSGTNFL